jgi:hypothetical protein
MGRKLCNIRGVFRKPKQIKWYYSDCFFLLFIEIIAGGKGIWLLGWLKWCLYITLSEYIHKKNNSHNNGTCPLIFLLPTMQRPRFALVNATFIWCSSVKNPRCSINHDREGFLSISLSGTDRTNDRMT